MSRVVLATIAALLSIAACSSGERPPADSNAPMSARPSAATPTQGIDAAGPSQGTSASPRPSTPRPEVPQRYLKSASSMSAKITEGLDLVNGATGGLELDNFSRADRRDALRGFKLLVEAADIGARAPLAGIPALDSAHNRVVSTLTDFAGPGVQAFSDSGPMGEADYLVAVLSAEDFLSAFDAWTAILLNLIE